jgi:hypothetical protein
MFLKETNNIKIMATNKSSNRRSSNSGRPRPMTARASLTMNSQRRYGCGGKLK